MNETIHAIFRGGAFVPLVPCNLPENLPVELVVHESTKQPPELRSAADRQSKLVEITERMMRNPWPANAPRFTRSQLHERR